MEFTLFLNTKYRMAICFESTTLEGEPIHLMKTSKSDEEVFHQLTHGIIDDAAEQGLAFIGYKEYSGEDGLMVFVDHMKALAAYQKELRNKGYEGSKITSIVITNGIKEHSISSDSKAYPPATTKTGENGRVYENYPAVFQLVEAFII